MATSTYTYRATGQGTMASGTPTPTYTAYSNGVAVATVTRWVTMPGSNAWGATTPTGATGAGATRNAAVAAALAAPAYTMPATYAAHYLATGGVQAYGCPTPCASCGNSYILQVRGSGCVCPACTTKATPGHKACRAVARAAYATARQPALTALAAMPCTTSVYTRARWAQQQAGYYAQAYYKATGNQATALGFARAMLARYLAS